MQPSRLPVLLLTVLSTCLGSIAQAQAPSAQDTCHWQSGFHHRGLNSTSTSLVVYDDGGGPHLYTAGHFSTADEQVAHYIVRWDGDAGWTPLGTGMNRAIEDLVVHDDGSGPALYASGYFEYAGGVAAKGLARWNGTAWSAVGELGVNARHLMVFDDGSGAQLYLIAFFWIGDVSETRLLRWDGSSYTQVATFDDWVSDLEVFDDGTGPALYVAGRFTQVNGIDLPALARWDGTSWSPVGGGVEPLAFRMTVHGQGANRSLIVSGLQVAGGVSIVGLAAWNGTSWSALPAYPASVTGGGRSMVSFDDGMGPALYVGGQFKQQVGSEPRRGVLRLRDGVWTVLEPSPGDSEAGILLEAQALAVLDDGEGPVLHAVGLVEIPGVGPRRTIAGWTGTEWRAAVRPARGIWGWINALANVDDGSGPALTAGGWFSRLDGYPENLVRWDGSGWRTLGEGLTGHGVFALAEFDDGSGPALYAGGRTYDRTDPQRSNLLRWDGASWQGLGSGVDDSVNCLLVHDSGSGSALIAGGDFTVAGGLPVGHIASWDGTSWSALGEGVEGAVYDLVAHDDGSGPALFASWTDRSEGVTQRGGVARWDGSTWSPLETVPASSAGPLAVFDDGQGPKLYASFTLTDLRGDWFTLVRRWDGTAWTQVGERFEGLIVSFGVHDDGRGPALYAAGLFQGVGEIDANGIACWTGTGPEPAWAALQGDFSSAFDQLAGTLFSQDTGRGPALLVGGEFYRVGDVVSSGIAKYTCDPLLFADDFERGDVRRWIMPEF